MLECTEIRHCWTSLPQLLLDGHLTLYRDERLFICHSLGLSWLVCGFSSITLEILYHSPGEASLAFVLMAAFYCKPNYEWRLYLQLG